MKNFKHILKTTAALIVIVLFSKCEDTIGEFVVETPSTFSLATIEITQLELDAVNSNNPILTLNWDQAEYGQQVSVRYDVEFSTDETFTDSFIGGSITGNNTLTFSNSELNFAVGKAGANPFVNTPVYIRIRSSLGIQISVPSYSNIQMISVIPYFNYTFNDYYLVGNGTESGWNNNNNNPALFRNPENEFEFNFTGYFLKGVSNDINEGRWKVLETKGSWEGQWGIEGDDNFQTSGDVAGNPGTQDSDPVPFGINTSGNYSFTINFSSLKYTIEPFEGSPVVSPSSLTIEGASLESNIALTKSTFDTNMWYTSNVRMVPGNIKFIADGLSWGATTEFSGIATADGGNIPVVVEDDYDIYFNALTGQYQIIPLNL